MRRSSTDQTLAPRDDNGDCEPPDASKYVKWRGTTGTAHWHWIDWNLNLRDCVAYPIFKSGPEDPGPRFREIPAS